MSYSQLTWDGVAVFAIGAGLVALGTGASLTTALVRAIVTMLLFGTLGWAANIFLMPVPARDSAQPEKGTKLDASVGDEPAPLTVTPAYTAAAAQPKAASPAQPAKDAKANQPSKGKKG